MDEILIGEKKYVSSKHAAKVTGYAKDYVGQLCREGRIPARLVGRSWYVLESAIKDHRFGSGDIEQASAERETISIANANTWEAPRYESVQASEIPAVNRPREEAEKKPNDSAENLQDAWQTWFSRIGEAPTKEDVQGALDELKPERIAGEEAIVPEPGLEPRRSEDVNVPIRTVYEMPPQRAMPVEIVEPKDLPPPKLTKNEPRPLKAILVLKLAAILLAVVTTSLALLGSGYLDSYIISLGQARAMAGVSIFNR